MSTRQRKRRRWAPVLRAGALAMLVALASPATARRLVVAGQPQRLLRIGGRTSLYYRVTPGEAAEVSVRGPARVKVIVRVEPRGDEGPVRMTVVVSEGGRRLRRRVFETSLAPDSVRWVDGGRATRSRALTVDVGEGTHRLRIRVSGANLRAVGLRPLRKRARAGRDQVPLAARGPVAAITVNVRERPREFYVARRGTPVRVHVVGPARLRVVTRYVYAERERGRRAYGVVVRRDGREVLRRALTTKKSLVVECPQRPHWVFGRSRTFYVEVPRGEHEIEVEPERDRAPGIVVRFTIAREAISNGKP